MFWDWRSHVGACQDGHRVRVGGCASSDAERATISFNAITSSLAEEEAAVSFEVNSAQSSRVEGLILAARPTAALAPLKSWLWYNR